jgi:tRNA A37 methylthiotransferase MiaB
MKTYIKTYGCTLNQSDSDIMRSVLEGSGIEVEARQQDADVTIVNTCTVKKPTEQRILYMLDRLVKSGARLVVTGCMASANADTIEGMHRTRSSFRPIIRRGLQKP